MTETWRQIPGFPHHEASSLGRIRRTVSRKGRPAGLILKQRVRPSGYVVVSISGSKHFVHRLVCAAFNGAAPKGQEVSHENGHHGDNAARNLLWRTHAENEALKVHHGTKAEGSRCGAAKLTELSAGVIRAVYRMRMHTQAEIAAFYGISRSSVGDIIAGRTWRHAQ